MACIRSGKGSELVLQDMLTLIPETKSKENTGSSNASTMSTYLEVAVDVVVRTRGTREPDTMAYELRLGLMYAWLDSRPGINEAKFVT